jgi:hypothetical protein
LSRNCLLRHLIEGNIEEMGRRGRRSKQLFDDLKDKIGYWKFKQEALVHPLYKNCLRLTTVFLK